MMRPNLKSQYKFRPHYIRSGVQVSHRFDVEFQHFFHVTRHAGEETVVTPITANMGDYDRPEWFRFQEHQPRSLTQLEQMNTC